MKQNLGKILVLVLSALSIAAFAYGFLKAFTSRYQESIFLFGVALVVLAQVVFVYRMYRYPDKKVEKKKDEQGEARDG